MSVWKSIARTFAVYFLSSFYTLLILFATLFRILFNGKSYFHVKPRPQPPSCLNDPQFGRHNYVKLKEVKLHYVEAGDNTKPLIVFLHGFPEFWYSWRHQIQEFKKDFWTVAVDMRGYGDSDKPSGVKSYHTKKLVSDIEELIVALGRSSCILVAHDWGGLVAWYLATQSPQLVERLIILNSPHPDAFFKLLHSRVGQFLKSWYIFFFQIPFIPEIILHLNDVNFIEKAFYSIKRGKEVFCDHDIEAYKYTFAKRSDFTPPINYYRNLRGKFFGDIREMPKVSVPVLIVWGTDDKALGTELATESSQHCDNCTVKYVKGASHWVQQDSPTMVNQFMREFLRGKAS